MKTFEDIKGDPNFGKLSPEAQGVVLEKVKPGFGQLSPDAQKNVLHSLTSTSSVNPTPDLSPSLDPVSPPPNVSQTSVKPQELNPLNQGMVDPSFSPNPSQIPVNQTGQVSFTEGMGNLGQSAMGGMGDFWNMATNPQTYGQMAGAVGDSINTELSGLEQAQQAFWQNPSLETYGNLLRFQAEMPAAAITGAADATFRQLPQGIANIIPDVRDSYLGLDPGTSDRVNIPESQLVQYMKEQHPFYEGLGEFVDPTMAIPTAKLAGSLGKLGKVGGKLNKLKQAGVIAGDAALGGGLNALFDPNEAGLSGRVTQGATGAALTGVLGGAAHGAGKVAKSAPDMARALKQSIDEQRRYEPRKQERPIGLGQATKQVDAHLMSREELGRLEQPEKGRFGYTADPLMDANLSDGATIRDGKVKNQSLETEATTKRVEENRQFNERQTRSFREKLEAKRNADAQDKIPSQRDKFNEKYKPFNKKKAEQGFQDYMKRADDEMEARLAKHRETPETKQARRERFKERFVKNKADKAEAINKAKESVLEKDNDFIFERDKAGQAETRLERFKRQYTKKAEPKKTEVEQIDVHEEPDAQKLERWEKRREAFENKQKIETPEQEKARLIEEAETEKILNEAFTKEQIKELDEADLRGTQLWNHAKDRFEDDPASVKAEHKKAVHELYTVSESPATRQDGEIHIVIGLPGAGKSSVLAKKLLKDYGAIEIDSDAAKPYFKEFGDGEGAGATHDFSDDVALEIQGLAMANNDNIVLPLVGKKLEKMQQIISDYNRRGYKVHLHNVDITPKSAGQRAHSRWKQTGRYVPPRYAIGVGLKPRNNFDILIKEGNLESYSEFSNEVKFGDKPEFIRSSLRPEGRIPGHRYENGNEVRRRVDEDRGQATSGEGSEKSQELESGFFGTKDKVRTSNGESLDVQYALVEKDQLITSHSDDLKLNEKYPQELQPRDRGRAASEAQIAKITSDLDPKLLTKTPTADSGAPIVGSDMVVESGNARTIAIRRSYKEHPQNIERYKARLKKKAEEYGFSADDLDGMKEPVLVRVRKTELDRVKFAEDAQGSGIASMSPVEKAKVDARRLDDDLLEIFNPSEEGDLNVHQNKSFLRQFVDKVVNEEDRASLIDADGNLSKDGVSRIERAVFTKAYKGGDALNRIAESTDDNAKVLSKALMMNAPDAVRLKNAIAKGDRHSLDLSEDLITAVDRLSKIRRDGGKVEEFLSQQNIFGEQMTPFQKEILKTLETNKRSAKKLATILKEYHELADNAGDPNQGQLIAVDPPSKEKLFAEAVERAKTNGQGSLFDPPPDKTPGGAAMKQAREAKELRTYRGKYDQAGFVGSATAVKEKLKTKGKTPPTPPQKKQQAPISLKQKLRDKGNKTLTGSVRKEPELFAQMKEAVKDAFSYMHKVRNKTFDIDGKQVPGNYFVALKDRLQARLRKGYGDAEIKVRNAVEFLEDERDYSASQKLDDVTEYLLAADYYRRSQQGLEVPGGLKTADLKNNLAIAQEHIRKHPELRKTAMNIRALLKEIGQDLKDHGVINATRKQYFPHQVLEHLQDSYGLPVKIQQFKPGSAKQAKGSIKDIDTDILGVLDAHLKTIERMKAIDSFVDKSLDSYAHPKWKLGQDLPEGFTAWQPRSGRNHYMAMTISETALLDAVIQRGISSEVAVQKAFGKLRPVLAVGGVKKTYAVPLEIADYMNRMYNPKHLEGVNLPLQKMVRWWKGVVTGSPVNPGLYAFHFKNAIGDLENGLRDDPLLTAYVLRAKREIIGARDGDPTKDFMSAEEWGTIGAGYYGSELDLSTADFNLKRRFSKGVGDKFLHRTPILSQMTKFYKGWEGFVTKGNLKHPVAGWIGEAREDWLRYAKFLKDKADGLEPWQAHIKNGNTFINYGHLTDFEKNVFRDMLLPFYTFYKSNAVNWAEGAIGKRGIGTASRTAFFMVGLPAAVATWNYMIDPETENLLQDRRSKRYLANMLHINTGMKDSNGNPMVVVLPTASNAALQLFGLSRVPTRIARVIEGVHSGKVTMTDAIKKQVTEAVAEDFTVGIGKDEGLQVPRPIAETVELVNPYIKEAIEQTFDYDLFRGKPITRGQNASLDENLKRRVQHVSNVAAPPYSRLSKFFNPNMDAKIRIFDVLTGVVKAPNMYSWSDLADEERRLKQEGRTLKQAHLQKFHEEVKQSMYEEMKWLVYEARIGDQNLQYGKAMNAGQRIRVKALLSMTKQGNGLSYSAQSKTGILRLIKDLDKTYDQKLTPQQKLKLKMFEGKMKLYLKEIEKHSEKRIRAAVAAVKSSNVNKQQSKVYKELTKNMKDPSPIWEAVDQKLLDGGIKYKKPRKVSGQ